MYDRLTPARTTRKELFNQLSEKTRNNSTNPTFSGIEYTYQFLSTNQSYAGAEPIIILLGLLESLIYEVHGNKRCAAFA